MIVTSRKTLRPRLVNVSGSPHGTSRTVCQRMCHTTKTSVPVDTTFTDVLGKPAFVIPKAFILLGPSL